MLKNIEDKKMGYIILFLFILTGLINMFLDTKNVYIILLLSLLYILLVSNIVKKINILYFSKILIYAYLIMDLLMILFSRLNSNYLFANIAYSIIFLFFMNKAEGIKGVKRGGLLLFVINLIKIVYITFLT